MDIRKKVAQYSLISTIMQGITLFVIVGLLIMMGILFFYLSGFITDSAGLAQNVNPDDVTAGWAVLFGAAGGLVGVLAGIILVFACIILIGPLIAEIVVFIYGIRTYKKRDSADFTRMVKNDSIIKLVVSAVVIIVSIFCMPSSGSVKSFVAQLDELIRIVVFDIPAIISVILSITVLRNIKNIEELANVSQAESIESYEDKSSYLWQ